MLLTIAVLLVVAGLFFVGAAVVFKRTRRPEGGGESARRTSEDDSLDLTRRRTPHETPAPAPGAPEWLPPGRDPEATA